MGLNNNATLVIGAGNFLTAVTGTALPVDLKAPEAAWKNVGHTSLEDILKAESEGGEATILGTLQNPSLRTTYSTRTESFTLNLQQFDEAGLKLYYGSNAKVVANMLQVPNTPTPTTCAFLAVFLDRSTVFAIYAPKCEIFRADALELSSTDSLASLPLKITPMQDGSNDWTYSVTPLGTV